MPADGLSRTVGPLVRATGGTVEWTPSERAAELPKMYALCQRYGLPSDFVTFSMNSPNDPLVIKIGSRRLGDGCEFVWRSTDYNARKLITKGVPATSARVFDIITRACLHTWAVLGSDDRPIGWMIGADG